MSRLIYKIIKIFQNIVIIILIFYVILYKNSATNFENRLLYDIHDLPCSTFKIIYQHGGDHVACGKIKIILHMTPYAIPLNMDKSRAVT